MKLKIVIKPEADITEKGCFIGLAIFIFVPFTIGIVTQTMYLLASLPIGLLLIGVFNLSNKGKFQYRNWIQTSYIGLGIEGLTYFNESKTEQFLWKNITNLEIKIVGYDREARSGIDDDSFLTGTENSISFSQNSKDYIFDFYLKEKSMKKELLILLKNVICPALTFGNITILTKGSTGYTTYSPTEFIGSKSIRS